MKDHLELNLDRNGISTSGRPSGRSQRTYRAVMTAAAELLAENGYASITIEGIAARANANYLWIQLFYSTLNAGLFHSTKLLEWRRGSGSSAKASRIAAWVMKVDAL